MEVYDSQWGPEGRGSSEQEIGLNVCESSLANVKITLVVQRFQKTVRDSHIVWYLGELLAILSSPGESFLLQIQGM